MDLPIIYGNGVSISKPCLASRHQTTEHLPHEGRASKSFSTPKTSKIYSQLKLGDFGIAKALQSDDDFTKTKLGTPYYLAPEICLGKAYSYPADIWMAGIVLYELMTLKKPFEEKSLHVLNFFFLFKKTREIFFFFYQGVVNKIVQEEAENINESYSENLKLLVKEMLRKDPEKRITIKEILKTPLIMKETEILKKGFKCYREMEEENNHQISFQEYLNDKLQKVGGSKDNQPESNQYSSIKNKESAKILLRYSSLPAQSFEIYSELKGRAEENKVINYKI